MAEIPKRQAALRLALATALLCASLIPLAACGKKPGNVDAPPDLEDDKYPRKYPDPETDPKSDNPPKDFMPPQGSTNGSSTNGSSTNTSPPTPYSPYPNATYR